MKTGNITTIQAMLLHGGSFVRALAQTYMCADFINRQKLENAFPEYWERYSGMALKHNKQPAPRQPESE